MMNKIMSHTIMGWLLKVIHMVVNENQTCGVPGRFISDNVALLRDAAHYATSCNAQVAVLSLDQEKAFDRVDWSFLHATLFKMGFGPSFVGWFDLLYSLPQSAVKFNGHITSFFNLSQGVRQGCSLSTLLYVLYAEVLACTIRSNPSITGLVIPGMAPCRLSHNMPTIRLWSLRLIAPLKRSSSHTLSLKKALAPS